VHVWRDSLIRVTCLKCVTWLIHTGGMAHSYVCHDLFICVTWLIHLWDMTYPSVWHDSSIGVTWRIHMWDMTYSCVRHDSFICETWLIPLCDTTHPYVRYDSFICETWLIHMWDMTHSYHMCGMTHSYVCHGSFIFFFLHPRQISIDGNLSLQVQCKMFHSHAWHDAFTRVTWLIPICDMTEFKCHDWIHMFGTSHSCVWYD